MVHRPPVAVLLATVLGFGCLYAPQPLLPLMAAEFGVSAQRASLLITLALLPPAVAPLLYGYVLEGVAAARMGRAVSGILADLGGWPVAFGFWGLGLPVAQIPMARLPAQGQSHFGRIRAAVLPRLLGDPRFGFAYLAILCVFFVFAGFLNVLPFRLAELSPGLGSTAVGLAYGGYLGGSLGSWAAPALQRNLGWGSLLVVMAVAAGSLFRLIRAEAA